MGPWSKKWISLGIPETKGCVSRFARRFVVPPFCDAEGAESMRYRLRFPGSSVLIVRGVATETDEDGIEASLEVKEHETHSANV